MKTKRTLNIPHLTLVSTLALALLAGCSDNKPVADERLEKEKEEEKKEEARSGGTTIIHSGGGGYYPYHHSSGSSGGSSGIIPGTSPRIAPSAPAPSSTKVAPSAPIRSGGFSAPRGISSGGS